MKVLILNNSDDKSGSAHAAYRLHQGLQKLPLQSQIQSQMLVQSKWRSDPTVIGSSVSSGVGRIASGIELSLDQLPVKLYKKRQSSYSPQWLPDRIVSKVRQISPDVVNLHWINGGFVQVETLKKLQVPLVWTLHDMWAFTGGCHYNQDCDRYLKQCGRCPQLGSSSEQDLSRWTWQRKARAWQNADLTIVALSTWLRDCAQSSSLFANSRVELIHNGIDTQTYRPIPSPVARQLLNLPQDKRLVLFGAMKATSDIRKGFHLLQPALQSLARSTGSDPLELVIFGSSRPDNPPDLGFPTHYLGTFSDDLSLSLVYSAADVFVAPSVQENLANTVMEALACGTPCVAFNIGGMPDLIDHQKNGYLAQPYKIEDLAQGIHWVLENDDRYHNLAISARNKVETEFTLEIQARRYAALFEEVLNLSLKNSTPPSSPV